MRKGQQRMGLVHFDSSQSELFGLQDLHTESLGLLGSDASQHEVYLL